MSSQKLCLVTGGTGVLGNGIRLALNEFLIDMKFIFLSSKDGDCCNYEDMKIIFNKYKPTHIIHLAARVGGLFANINDNIGFFQDNMAININILNLCHEFKIQNGIFCLSTCIFPNEASLPLTEEKIHDGPTHHSNEGYATAKRNLEMLIRFYRKKYSYNWICIIPTNLYGPFDNFNLKDSHVIPALIHKCYFAKKFNQVFIIKGSGKPFRQFLFSLDAGKIILQILKTSASKLKDSSYILCDYEENEFSIAHISQLIADSFDYKDSLEFDLTSSDGIYKKTASNKRLIDLIGTSFEFTPLVKGISITTNWFIENYDKCRK